METNWSFKVLINNTEQASFFTERFRRMLADIHYYSKINEYYVQRDMEEALDACISNHGTFLVEFMPFIPFETDSYVVVTEVLTDLAKNNPKIDFSAELVNSHGEDFHVHYSYTNGKLTIRDEFLAEGGREWMPDEVFEERYGEYSFVDEGVFVIEIR